MSLLPEHELSERVLEDLVPHPLRRPVWRMHDTILHYVEVRKRVGGEERWEARAKLQVYSTQDSRRTFNFI